MSWLVWTVGNYYSVFPLKTSECLYLPFEVDEKLGNILHIYIHTRCADVCHCDLFSRCISSENMFLAK